jgi:hypothetical protein
MALIKLNDRAVKDVTQFGSISSLGSLTHISTATASSSASIEFTSGIDSTYKEYIFYFVNIHAGTNDTYFSFNFSTDSGSNYNVIKTTTYFNAIHQENGALTQLAYKTNQDLAQSTSFQGFFGGANMNNDNDNALAGYLHLYNPSSTTFVKHFNAVTNHITTQDPPYLINSFVAGYGNTTSSIDAIQFKMDSGNIDSGQILLFGVN